MIVSPVWWRTRSITKIDQQSPGLLTRRTAGSLSAVTVEILSACDSGIPEATTLQKLGTDRKGIADVKAVGESSNVTPRQSARALGTE
jgi:hypothetical protein